MFTNIMSMLMFTNIMKGLKPVGGRSGWGSCQERTHGTSSQRCRQAACQDPAQRHDGCRTQAVVAPAL